MVITEGRPKRRDVDRPTLRRMRLPFTRAGLRSAPGERSGCQELLLCGVDDPTCAPAHLRTIALATSAKLASDVYEVPLEQQSCVCGDI